MDPAILSRISLVEGDITRQTCDAIVNAANTSLLGGGGVDGAIHRAAGPELLAECRLLDGCETGDAKITRGYRLPARHVIHTVGPVYRDGLHREPELLRSCYHSSLKLAVEHGVRTIAFPAVSCGVYRFPVPDAAGIALRTTADFLAQHTSLERVTFVLFGKHIFEVYQQTLDSLRAGRP